ncbi:complement regulator-acquiring protein (plasmid) [Borrelia miyamotoi]|uniref:Complement regulator-acquiring protein n=2 Tax=Borrelia miyamotoi TaxID=47466 RepID=A0A5P8AY00_9SPIR|nr:complement regulator-acquiring protein [Borrelia miyamotoi]ATQ19224.1 complement regulator-acquiring protein [Borrelia miyamotoi]QFP42541.1 complement regulator-acquiring protein [Borrelia miyamotoi]WAZ72334.1 complement regulator-acquiring protein [Borrelia miyamotoi]WAZ72806.1 complement regulator-acquiring protein [Borrelia miyamotoi]WAZ72828.1 complement regulator-acquiring protein [Borrelia miyamotoi]
MKKTLFIFKLLILGLVVSCNLDSKLLDTKERNKDVSKGVVNGVKGDEPAVKEESVRKEVIEDDDSKEVVNGVQGDESSSKGYVFDEKEKLISELKKDIDNVKGLVSQDKAEVEDENQYGMKDQVFKAVVNTANNKTLEHDENKELRRLFYSSLLYNKDKIKEFAEILKKIESDNTNKGTWIRDIMNVSILDLQSNFEEVIAKLEANKDKLDKLSLDDLREVKTKLEEIQLQKLNWRKAVNSLIESYKAKTDDIDSDSEKLIKHVEKEYKDLITVKIPGMKSVYDKIVGVLDTIE